MVKLMTRYFPFLLASCFSITILAQTQNYTVFDVLNDPNTKYFTLDACKADEMLFVENLTEHDMQLSIIALTNNDEWVLLTNTPELISRENIKKNGDYSAYKYIKDNKLTSIRFYTTPIWQIGILSSDTNYSVQIVENKYDLYIYTMPKGSNYCIAETCRIQTYIEQYNESIYNIKSCLANLQSLFDEKLITEEEYTRKREFILNRFDSSFNK